MISTRTTIPSATKLSSRPGLSSLMLEYVLFSLGHRLIVPPMNSKEAQEFLDSRENMTSGGTAWERIAKLVDLTEKGARSGKSDKSRFREMLLSLKKDEKVRYFPPSLDVNLTNIFMYRRLVIVDFR